jgi:hypothetical protein
MPEYFPEENVKSVYDYIKQEPELYASLKKKIQKDISSEIADIGGMSAGITKAEKVLGRAGGKIANAIASKIIDPTDAGRKLRDYDTINDLILPSVQRADDRKSIEYLDSGMDRKVFTNPKNPNEVVKVPTTNSEATNSEAIEQMMFNRLMESGLSPITKTYRVAGKNIQTQSRVVPYGDPVSKDGSLVRAEDVFNKQFNPGSLGYLDDMVRALDIRSNDLYEAGNDGNFGGTRIQSKLDEAISSAKGLTGNIANRISEIPENVLKLLQEQSKKMLNENASKTVDNMPIVLDISRMRPNEPAASYVKDGTIPNLVTTDPDLKKYMEMLLKDNNKVPLKIGSSTPEELMQIAKNSRVKNYEDLTNIDGKNLKQLEPFLKQLDDMAKANINNSQYEKLMLLQDYIKSPYIKEGDVQNIYKSDLNQVNTKELLDAAIDRSKDNNVAADMTGNDAIAALINRIKGRNVEQPNSNNLDNLNITDSDINNYMERMGYKKDLQQHFPDESLISPEIKDIINQYREYQRRLSAGENTDAYSNLKDKIKSVMTQERMDRVKGKK